MVAETECGNSFGEYVDSNRLSGIWTGKMGSLNSFDEKGSVRVIYGRCRLTVS